MEYAKVGEATNRDFLRFMSITPVLVNIFAQNFQEMLRGSRLIFRENMKLKYRSREEILIF